MEGARFLALLLYFEGRVEGHGAIAPLKRDALHVETLWHRPIQSHTIVVEWTLSPNLAPGRIEHANDMFQMVLKRRISPVLIL